MKFLVLSVFFMLGLAADEKLIKFCEQAVSKADSVKALEGKEGWLFPFKEIQHLAPKKQFSENALTAIVEYKKALASENIELLIVPVPPKALIYKEFLTGQKSDWNPYSGFHEKLKEQKVNSLDLVPLFYENKEKQVFCKRDSHFSPPMASVIATALFLKTARKSSGKKYSSESIEVDFEGDLTRQSEKEFDKEKFKIEYLMENKDFIEANPQSPVILMGDSNCLIFSSGGEMHTRGAGIFDFLSQSFGQNIDLLGVKGSGVDIARVDFFRRSMDINYLRKKKLVIWLFAAYELTESRGWKKIPVRR